MRFFGTFPRCVCCKYSSAPAVGRRWSMKSKLVLTSCSSLVSAAHPPLLCLLHPLFHHHKTVRRNNRQTILRRLPPFHPRLTPRRLPQIRSRYRHIHSNIPALPLLFTNIGQCRHHHSRGDTSRFAIGFGSEWIGRYDFYIRYKLRIETFVRSIAQGTSVCFLSSSGGSIG